MSKSKVLVMIIVCASVLIFLLGILLLQNNRLKNKDDVCQFVLSNRQALESFIDHQDWNKAEGAMKRYGALSVRSWNEATMIQFNMYSFGLGPSTSYKGFYYVADDRPVGMQGADLSFSPAIPGCIGPMVPTIGNTLKK